ncbi:MAG TPA: molybdopterin molybdotransferase MoeA [Clostridia bacterium]|nr:molybdopterin molybdotransferase MoeA [Clostridia bacterium]
MLKTVEIAEARQRIFREWSGFRGTEEIGLLDALGRCLAEDIIAQSSLPGFGRSTVDGFAVQSRETFGVTESLPRYLEVIGELKMGTLFSGQVQPGQALQIPTGGALPPGADAVVMLEYTEWLDEETIGILRPASPGENVIQPDEDATPGEKVLEKGSCLRPQELGFLAALGILRVQVYLPLKVGIISTGNEIVPPEKTPLSGQVRDVNSYSLYGLVKQSGGQPRLYGIVDDDFLQLKDRIERSLAENDLVLISGGSSVGTRDYTVEVLEDLSGEPVFFHGLPVKPGKPTVGIVIDGKPVFGLPGHPVSATVVYDLMVDPLIRYGDYREVLRPVIMAKLTRNFGSAAGRLDYLRVRLQQEDGQILAEPVLGKSGLISTLVKADGVVEVPMLKEGLLAGEMVAVKLF